MKKKTTISPLEIEKFSQLASEWWDPNGLLKTLHDINPTRIAFMQKFTELSGKTILDIGCGGGILSEGMAKLGAEVTGLDVGKEAISAAQLHAEQNQLPITYVCKPIEKYKTAQFEIVTCMEMLEHVTEPHMVIEHCARLLKPGGFLFLSTINRNITAYASAIIAAEYILKLLPRQTHDYEKFLKPSELAGMIRAVGLETTGLSGMSYNPLTRSASLQDSVSINYLLAAYKVF